MTGTLTDLLVAALVFVTGHVLTSTPARAAIVGWIGERAWALVFSLFSITVLVWMAMAYGAAPYEELWFLGGWARWVPILVMPVAFALVVAGATTPNPTAVMAAKVLESPDPAPGIAKITRHPIMWGIALWALAHLFPNGDAASLIFFGSLAALALAGTVLLDWKLEARAGADAGPFLMTTSAIPFLAAIQGRTRIDLAAIGWWRIALGLVIYAVFLFGHKAVIGLSALPV
ncbi:MAG: NnrU family protein [Rhodospirillaceae bacterium]|nr:NnrU family protein [Rhodospirillaceae bacterium]